MSDRINELFSSISGKYDFMNHFLSMGIDKRWRAAAAAEAIKERRSYRILDVATGTGDLAIALAGEARRKGAAAKIAGMDFNTEMIRLAKQKISRFGLESEVLIEKGDAMKMKYKPCSFDVVVSGFALRNFDSLKVFSKELIRVLRPGGRFVLLDMAMPDSGISRSFFKADFKVIKLIGSVVQKGAYSWLVSSVSEFDKKKFAGILEKEGFTGVGITNLTTGLAFFVSGTKPKS